MIPIVFRSLFAPLRSLLGMKLKWEDSFKVVSVLDSRTFKVLSSIGEPNLKRNGSQYEYNSLRLLWGERSDTRFRTLHNDSGRSRVDEFDKNAKRIGSYILPDDAYWYLSRSHTLSLGRAPLVYFNEAGSVFRYDIGDKKRTLLMEKAVEEQIYVEWMRRLDDETVAVSISCFDKGPNSGSVIILPLNGTPPTLIYRNPRAACAIPSNDLRLLLVSFLAGRDSELAHLAIVDPVTGAEERIAGSNEALDPFLVDEMVWSPNDRTIAFSNEYKVYSYSLDTKELRVLKLEGNSRDSWMSLEFIDNDRLCYLHFAGDTAKDLKREFEIIDHRTGKTLFSKSVKNAIEWHVFANGNRIAVWDSESEPPKTFTARFS